MIPFGETLRAAREAKGLSAADVARETNLLARQVEALENEDFSHIAAAIYGRGFVKMYCHTVGLDPQPLVEAFMDIYSGRRQPAPARKAAAAQPPAPQQPPPPPVQTSQPGDEPDAPSETEAEPQSEPPMPPVFTLTREVEPPHVEAPAPAAPPERLAPRRMPKPASRYAAPAPHARSRSSQGLFGIPPAAWRALVLIVALGLIVWGICTAARKIYNAAMQEPEGRTQPAQTQTAQTAEQARRAAPAQPAAPEPGAKRKPMKIDQLYID